MALTATAINTILPGSAKSGSTIPGEGIAQLTVDGVLGSADLLSAVISVANGLPANAYVTRIDMGPGRMPVNGAAAELPVLDIVNQTIDYINTVTGALKTGGATANVTGMVLNVTYKIL